MANEHIAAMDFTDGKTAETVDAVLLREAGVDVQGERCKTEEDVIRVAQGADVLLDGMGPITRKVLSSLPRVRVVARYGVGVDNVDLEAATDEGIVVTHVPDYCIEEVSNHVIAFLLVWAKQLVQMERHVRGGAWASGKANPVEKVQSVHQQTLGIVGAGRIGMATALKGKALSMKVLVYDPYLDPGKITAQGLVPAEMAQVLAESDYVSIHTPLTPETRHFIGADQFKGMKQSAFLINVSRGPIVDEAALAEALQAGTIAGAGLDVFETEPLPSGSPLYKMENVLLSPHSAHFSPIGTVRARRQIAEEVLRALGGEFPVNIANPAVRAKARMMSGS